MIFPNVVGFQIPEGDVAKVAVNGVTIWEATNDNPMAGYTPCEYLQLDGSQYVDTGIYGNLNTTLEIVFTRETTSKFYLCGAESSGNKATVTAYLGGYWRFGAKYTTPTVATDVKHTAIASKSNLRLNGGTIKFNGTEVEFTTPHSIILGTSHLASGSVNANRHIGKIYSFKAWDGESLIADYIPCRNSQGVYGFWDDVAKVFRESEGSAPFGGG